jgi:AP-1-like factor
MDATSTNPNNISPRFTLSPHEEELLFAALNSNPATALNVSPKDRSSMAPTAFTESPVDGSGSLPLNGFEESPFIDYDYEFDPEAGFDYDFANDSQAQMIGKLPGTSSDGDAEGTDKRSHPDDEEEGAEGGGKRREGDEKISKKPGRKPLTSEPTSVSSHGWTCLRVSGWSLTHATEAQGTEPCRPACVPRAQGEAP